MPKPIKDYTLGEVKELCEPNFMCKNCPLDSWCDRYLSHAPAAWDLEEIVNAETAS